MTCRLMFTPNRRRFLSAAEQLSSPFRQLLADAVEKGKFGRPTKICRAVDEIFSRAAGGPAEKATNAPAVSRIELGSV
jgi:hypothetical protein